MPRGDGTGPFGNGPRSGRGQGFCAGSNRAGIASAGQGRGMGRGLGLGGGRNGRRMQHRNQFIAAQASDFFGADASMSEIELLRQQAESLTSASAEIQARIAALEAAAKTDRAEKA